MNATPDTDARADDSSMWVDYARLLFAAHALCGVVAWGGQASVAPVTLAIVLATGLALWAAFGDFSVKGRWGMLGLCVLCIVIIGFAVPTRHLPRWLFVGPWNPLLQAVAVAGALLIGTRPRRAQDSVDSAGGDVVERGGDGVAVGGGDLQLAVAEGDDAERDSTETDDAAAVARNRKVVRGGLLMLAVAAFGYLVVLPLGEDLIARSNPEPTSTVMEDMTVAEWVRLRVVETFSALWAFSLGACVGSFVNVLVYRQPRGESVLTQPSACPSCQTKIQTRDNIPVFGWVMLGGRCRTCGTPISARYPIVEAIAGVLFAVLLFVELTSGGANLPIRGPNAYTGFVWTIFYPKWDLICLTVFHFHLFAMLLTWALMTWDRVVVPWRSILTAWAVAVSGPLLWNRLWLMPAWWDKRPRYPFETSVVVTAVASGAGAGLVLAAVAFGCRCGSFRTLSAAFVLLGATLGWQAVVVIGVVTLVVYAAVTGLAGRSINFPGLLLATAFTHHLFWRLLFEQFKTWTAG